MFLRVFVKTSGLSMTAKQAGKKWTNMKEKYKVILTMPKMQHYLTKGPIEGMRMLKVNGKSSGNRVAK